MTHPSVSGTSVELYDEVDRRRTLDATVERSAAPVAARAGTNRAGASGRNGGVDALRAAVTLLVVFHHTAITYGAIGGWYYKELAPSNSPSGALLILFCTVNQAWFMGLFFLLAGYYTPPGWRRRGTAGFIRERLLRLGVPLVVYFLVLHPLTVALAQTARGHPFLGLLGYLWAHGRFEPGPLWFAEALLIFSAAWLAWRSMRKPAQARTDSALPSDLALLAAAIATGMAAFLLRLVWPIGVNVAFLQLSYFASYVVLFAAGCAAADGKWLERVPERRTKLWRRIAWLALPVFPIVAVLGSKLAWLGGRAEGGFNVQALTYAVWEPFLAFGFILALLSLFQRRFVVLGSVWQSLARRAYLIYIIHPPVLVGTALLWRDIAAPALIKFLVTGSIACALCYVLAGLVLRIPGLARIV